MSKNSIVIRESIYRFLKYSLILLFIIFFLRVLESQSPFIQFKVFEYTVTDKLVIRLIATTFFIYYGYFVIVDLKFFVDILNQYTAKTLGYNESNKIKNIAYSVASIISLFLASLLVLPFVSSIPTYGELVAGYLNLAFLALIFLIIYNISSTLYSLMKDKIDEAIEELSKKINQELSIRSKKET